MSSRILSIVGAITFLGCLLSSNDAIRSADFSVATRDDVLTLTSKIQATQFLTHATFGATQTEIDQLATQMRQLGTIAAASAWIDAQATLPASMHQPLEYAMLVTDSQFGSLYRGGTPTVAPDPIVPDTRHALNRVRYRQNAWWHTVISGQDQLRQRMAWALAQIFSVGESGTNFNAEEWESTVVGGPNEPPRSRFQGLSNYYDIFVANAFGKYRDVIGKVTYNSIMGDWLSFRGNRRAQNGVFPDENYAREVMQLFTIGLNDLRDDGTARTNAQGVIPTYDADDIREYAEVFTGLGYGYGIYDPSNLSLNPFSPYTGNASANPNGALKYQVPMRMAPSQHDRSEKLLLNGLILPATNGGVEHTENSANAEINAALDGLFAHPSCPPFVVSRLIQRFVISNPSKAYISRVVSIFKDNGQGVRGDLKAVVKAILLDPEAWQPIRVQYHRSPVSKFVVTTLGTEDSRLQEPVLSYTRFTRFFKATSQYQKATAGIFPSAPFPPENVVTTEFRLNTLEAQFDQSPYKQPSVFNFYVADYQPPGEIVAYVPTSRLPHDALFAPEFQIVNAITSNSTGNFFRTISSGTRTENYLFYFGTAYTNSAGITNIATESTRTVVTYDFSLERAMLVDQPPGEASGSPARVNKLIEHLDLYLCGGTLGEDYKNILRSAITDEVNLAGGVGDVTATEVVSIVRGIVLAIVTAPSFLVTE